MKTKKLYPLGVTLTAGLLAALGAAPQAQAAVTNHSGTICKNFNASEATLIDYQVSGTRNLKNGNTWVICPLTRDTQNSNGAYVYVDVTHTANATTTCTAYSYFYPGSWLASASDAWTGSGFHTFALNLAGAWKSDAYSNYSVLCSIPGNREGVITRVHLYEQ